jgi:hypothetical protein
VAVVRSSDVGNPGALGKNNATAAADAGAVEQQIPSLGASRSVEKHMESVCEHCFENGQLHIPASSWCGQTR